MYKNHVISTHTERLTSGFRIPSRPDHNGADFICWSNLQITPRGVDIIALAEGIIVEVVKGNLIGNTVSISHEGKILTCYQHLRDGVPVKKGDKVVKGQVIGVMGNTGDCRSARTDIPIEF